MKKRRPITSYGRLVLARMEAKNMSLFDLAQEVERRTGRFYTEAYIQGYIRGSHTPWPQDHAIRDVLGLQRRNEYSGKNTEQNRAGSH